MKNKAKTTFMSVIAMGFVLAVVIFMYYYQPTKQETEELVASNATLQSRVDELKAFYDEMPENKRKIEEMKVGIQKIVDEFPVDVKDEDTIYLAITSTYLQRLQELYKNKIVPESEQFSSDLFNDTGVPKILYAGINIGETEELARIEESVIKGAKIEGLESNLSFQKKVVDYINVTDYNSLKGLIQSVNSDPDKKTIAKLSYNTNEEGLLSGTISVNFYSLSGTNKPYVAKDLGEYYLGVDNLFVGTSEE